MGEGGPWERSKTNQILKEIEKLLYKLAGGTVSSHKNSSVGLKGVKGNLKSAISTI